MSDLVRVVFISGPYGSGKTTTFDQLKRRIHSKVAFIEEDFVGAEDIEFQYSNQILFAYELITRTVRRINEQVKLGKTLILCDSGPLENIVYRKGCFNVEWYTTLMGELHSRFFIVRSYVLLIPDDERWSQVKARMKSIRETDEYTERWRLGELNRCHFYYTSECYNIVKERDNFCDVFFASSEHLYDAILEDIRFSKPDRLYYKHFLNVWELLIMLFILLIAIDRYAEFCVEGSQDRMVIRFVCGLWNKLFNKIVEPD